MNKKEAKEKISWWFHLPNNQKDRNWNSIIDYINKYPDIYLEEVKKRTSRLVKREFKHRG